MTTEFPVVTPLEYTCPGHRQSISRAVHLSRMATFYPACRDCVHRDDTHGLARTTIVRLARTQDRVTRNTLFEDEGVRGVHRNELTRRDADRLVSALAWLCWQDRPPGIGGDTRTRSSPVIVVGHDTRPAARDLLAGVLASLVRSGCRALEIGSVSDACFRFAVDHLQADAGVRVTGAGRPVSWIGLDAVAGRGRPVSRGAGLDAWENAADSGHPRPTRQSGHRRSFQVTEAYEATLRRHLLASRPLAICLSAPAGTQSDSLTRLLSPLPWNLVHSAARTGTRQQTVAELTRDTGSDLGITWDHDGDLATFCDETGATLDPLQLFVLLATRILSDHPDRTVVLAASCPDHITTTVRRLGGRPRTVSGSSRASTWQAIADHDAVLGLDENNSTWFGAHTPTQDPLLTVSHLLQTLDRHERPLSELLARNS
ncbi:MAG TPA: hypothetical protein DIC23_15295 [Planctomycetaceae bacterium]|nr:hypothetical protein [Planctomycetaceae bacterium]